VGGWVDGKIWVNTVLRDCLAQYKNVKAAKVNKSEDLFLFVIT
jgi:hypothetical protein